MNTLTKLFIQLFIGYLPILMTGCNNTQEQHEAIVREVLKQQKEANETTVIVKQIEQEKFPEIAEYYYKKEFRIDGMKYVIYNRYDGGIAVINYTKDSLEVAKLKLIPNE